MRSTAAKKGENRNMKRALCLLLSAVLLLGLFVILCISGLNELG